MTWIQQVRITSVQYIEPINIVLLSKDMPIYHACHIDQSDTMQQKQIAEVSVTLFFNGIAPD